MHPALVDTPNRKVFYWNVDATVGLNGVNKFEDVLFVQWCFRKLGQWTGAPPQFHGMFRDLPITGQCSGRDGDPLISAIRTLQQFSHGQPDGRVSPAERSEYSYHQTSHHYLIFYLNAVLRRMHPDQYPRIDLMPEFIWRIKETATHPFI